eukprot:4293557-Alexandrium_andersonii.AAC.1
MGRQAGLEQLFRHLQADFEDHPEHVLVKVDIKNAFGRIDRSMAAAALAEALPLDTGVIARWVQAPATHYWYDRLSQGHA